MCVRLLAEADAPGLPRRNGQAGSDPSIPSRRGVPAREEHHGVTLTTFLDQTPSVVQQPDIDPDATAADLASLEAETTAEDLALDPAAIRELAAAPVAAIVPKRPAAAEPDEADEPVEHDDVLDIEDSTRLYLREIARVPLLTAEEEVMLAKTMELGKRIETDPASAILDLHVWAISDSEPKARTKHSRYRHVFVDESARIVR